MRKLILGEWITIDGYAADKHGNLDFFRATESDRYSDLDQLKFMDTVDTILIGRKTYELFVDFWPTATTDKELIADKLNETPKIVFSNTLKKAPWGKWPDARVLGGDAVTEIKKLKDAPGKDIVLWGSISLAQAMMKANLVDEYHIQYCPTILGGGRRLFLENDSPSYLKLVSTRKYDAGVVFLQYAI